MQRITKHARQYAIFAFVGVCGLGVNLAVTFWLTERVGLWYFASFVISALVAWTLMFFGNLMLTFRGTPWRGRLLARYGAFLGTYTASFLLNASLVLALTSGLGIRYLVSIAVSSVLTSFVTFAVNKIFVYH